ncbi:hypothetical protein ACQWE9_25695, partial [Salmonella enterica subsp. enterica serovar Infantis]
QILWQADWKSLSISLAEVVLLFVLHIKLLCIITDIRKRNKLKHRAFREIIEQEENTDTSTTTMNSNELNSNPKVSDIQ